MHIADVHGDAEYEYRHLAQGVDFRSMLAIPMLRDGRPIGTINVHRAEPGPSTTRRSGSWKPSPTRPSSPIENARLFKELEARNRDLTATSEILQVISSSPTDVAPVFDALAGNAVRRKFIELHGGRIWVKSQVGMGSTFTFTLPLIIDRLP